jgi:peptide methionine sulfoxide reductase msrA/msrB
MKNIIIVLLLVWNCSSGCTQTNSNSINEQGANKKKSGKMNFNTLTPEEERVIVYKGTEMPFTGKYDNFYKEGTYVCKRCDAPLYRSADKFKSGCGWPSFDDEITGAIKRVTDADGRRTEILCAKCDAHLGHVFVGERFTPKNTRHCVNSVSLNFVPLNMKSEVKTDTAIFAGGCFWGVEYYMQKAPGVISTEVGYIGGSTKNPSYKEVCSHTTGHAEAIQIVFDPAKTTYENLARLFFEIHDPTQVNRQGPDIGDQYRSAVFYFNDEQKMIAEKLIGLLKQKGLKVATQLVKATTFWKAEDYHQDYYNKEGKLPYCHAYVKRF